MTNYSSTTNTTSETNFASSVHLYWIFFCQGLFLIPSNVLIFGAIVFHEPLRQRKEYILIAGLALLDVCEGFGLVICGLMRNLLIMNGAAGKLVSRIDCLLKPWNWILSWAGPLGHIFELTVSIDRFIAVRFPLHYYALTTRYSYCLVGGTYLFMFVNLVTGIIITLPYTYPEKQQICFTDSAFEDSYRLYYSWLAVVADFSSIILYIVVIFVNAKMTKLSEGSQRISAMQKKAMDVQRKVTTTLSICSICTFAFNCVPLMIKLLVAPYFGGVFNLLVPYTYVFNQINPISNFFVFTIRQRDLRKGVKNLLKCTKLSQSMLHAVPVSGVMVEPQSGWRLRSINATPNLRNA